MVVYLWLFPAALLVGVMSGLARPDPAGKAWFIGCPSLSKKTGRSVVLTARAKEVIAAHAQWTPPEAGSTCSSVGDSELKCEHPQ